MQISQKWSIKHKKCEINNISLRAKKGKDCMRLILLQKRKKSHQIKGELTRGMKRA